MTQVLKNISEIFSNTSRSFSGKYVSKNRNLLYDLDLIQLEMGFSADKRNILADKKKIASDFKKAVKKVVR